MTSLRITRVALAAIAVIAGGWFFHDPPWVATTTSGLRPFEMDDKGTRFRWTAGHASFFVPSSSPEVTLPVRAVYPDPSGAPVTVSVSVDDRWVVNVSILDLQSWTDLSIPLPAGASRDYRRIDVTVGRTIGQSNYGVQLGEIRLASARESR